MKFLILSDIHGNLHGLQAVLNDARGEWQQLLCLGDVVGYGAHPNECCALLQQQNAWCLLGNHDAAALGDIEIEWFNPVAKEAILWTRGMLSPDNQAWLKSLCPTLVSYEHGFQAVHGSLREPLEEYITGTYTAVPTFALMETPLCFFGHTHIAEGYRTVHTSGEGYDVQHQAFLEGGTIRCEPEWRYLINPGSCGQPRDGNPQARYALYDTETRIVDVQTLSYDWELARQAIIDAGLPRLLGDRLERGR